MTIRKLQGTLLVITIAVTLIALALPASAATECVTFNLAYEVRPGPAQALIGVTVDVEVWDLPDHWAGLPGTLHVETANGPSVHWNNYATFATNGFNTNVTGTEDTANGVRIGDTTVTALGPTLDFDYTIGVRDSRDVPGVEGASLEGTVTICAIVEDTTTTTSTTVPEPSTTTIPTTTTTGPTTSSSTTSTTAPPATTTTAPNDNTTTTEGTARSTSTIPPVTPDSTLPFTGPIENMIGLSLAGAALIILGAAALIASSKDNA